jgi:hypothetical protein
VKTNETARSRWTSLVWSAAFWAAGLLLAGSIGWLWFALLDDSAWKASWKALPLVAALLLAACVGTAWLRSRAGRRLRAALDAYAEQEEAKRTYSRRDGHARPRSRVG